MEKKNQLFEKSIQKNMDILRQQPEEKEKNGKKALGLLPVAIAVVFAVSVALRMLWG